jgi:2-polyprenyl-6-methoxyphenol hydroxylase-like FAD-dependent oxidoreductase
MAEVAIQGAGIAGCALALLLARRGHSVTIFERAQFLRGGGQAVDVRGAALKVMEELKLIEEVRACRTHLRGMSVCDEHDNELERTTERTLGGGRFDNDDIELFREDLSRILFSASSELVTYVFGDEVVSGRQQSDCVDVELRNGGERSFDLLVGADGLHSGIRRMAFGRDEEFVHPAGFYAGIYSTSNSIGLDAWQLVFRTPERGIIVYPNRSNDQLRVALYFADGGSEPPLQDTVAQKRALKAPFGDVGGRFRTLVAELDGADDLYASEMAQVRMRRWSVGRIVLAGDAAYCPSPLTGQGTSLALVGAYVLAEEIARSTGDLAAAAESHERRLRQFVEANLAIDLRTGKGIDDAKNAIAI